MGLRALLVALIVAATATFVVGVSIERGDEAAHHDAAGEAAAPSDEHQQPGGEAERSTRRASPPTRCRASRSHMPNCGRSASTSRRGRSSLAAALASLALAAGAWLRPRRTALLTLVALAMLAFAVLDVREVLHQADIDESGLAILAGAVAALHLAAAFVAAAMASRSRSSVAAPTGPTGTLAA